MNKEAKPAARWTVEDVFRGSNTTLIAISETQYLADQDWPKPGEEIVLAKDAQKIAEGQ